MSPEYVLDQVERIRQSRFDSEGAHSMEDALYKDVLKAIADGTATNPAECARIALQAADIDFERWYA